MDPILKKRIEQAIFRIRSEMTEKRKKQPYIPILIGGGVVVLLAIKARVNFDGILGIASLTFSLIGYLYYIPYREAQHKFKGFILPKIAEMIHPGLKYQPTATFNRNLFNKADLFQSSYTTFKAEDEFTGKSKGVLFGLREVCLRKAEKRSKKTTYVTVFQGLVLNLEFHKNFLAHTHIAPDNIEKIMGGYMGGIVQDATNMFSKRKRVQMEHPEFEKYFIVSSTDQQEARYLITPKMMELLMSFRKEFGKDCVFSFFDNCLYIAFSYPPIEFSFNETSCVNQIADKMQSLLLLTNRVIEQLDLDNPIWKKTS